MATYTTATLSSNARCLKKLFPEGRGKEVIV